MGYEQPSKEWNAASYDDKLGFVSALGKPVLEWLGARRGERVLDVGCGTGDLCKQLADDGMDVHGIDLSADMIAAARRKYPELSFEVADAHTYRAAAPYDAVFSNAALHWMLRPREVIGAVKRALRPGGRFVAEFGGHGNVQCIARAVDAALRARGMDASERNPWYFPTLGQYTALLEEAGFRVARAAHFARPTPLADGERGLDHWLDAFAAGFFAGMPEAERRGAYADIRRHARPSLFRGGAWQADYWRLRVLAYAPPAGALAGE